MSTDTKIREPELVARYWYCMYRSELMPMGKDDPQAYREEAARLRVKLGKAKPEAGMPVFEKKRQR